MTKQTVRSDEPTEYNVEQRMNKLFTIAGDPGGAGSPSISVQSPDAVDRNLILGGDESASAAVQSPDAADRNLAFTMASESAPGAVQSPDAIERNLAYSAPSGSEPRDIAPVDLGDGSHLAPTYGDGDLSQ
jgi:hypothetical protein